MNLIPKKSNIRDTNLYTNLYTKIMRNNTCVNGGNTRENNDMSIKIK